MRYPYYATQRLLHWGRDESLRTVVRVVVTSRCGWEKQHAMKLNSSRIREDRPQCLNAHAFTSIFNSPHPLSLRSVCCGLRPPH